MPIAFDTHEAAKELGRAGFTDAQVEALVSIARQTTALPDISSLAAKSDIADLATKADIAELRAATGADIAELRLATKADVAELRLATKADIAELRTDIATAKLQAITILLPGIGAMMAIISVASRMVH